MTELKDFKFVITIVLEFKKIQTDDKTLHSTFYFKQNSISISVFGYENKIKHPIYVSKKCCEGKQVDLLLIGEEGKRHHLKHFQISIHSCMITCYILEENIFVIIIYKPLERQKHWNIVLKIPLRLMVKKD